ncbi:MAG TPA: feruloyl-CoA synthase [Burkholderiales bacterium]|nr:feruloyl-CoA synthase [Burkholderiales bacterium]
MSTRVRPVRLGGAHVEVERRAGGVLRLRSPHELGPYPAKLTERLDHWAAQTPDAVFLAQRPPGQTRGGEWQKLSYAEVREGARRIGQALLDRNLSVERPVAVLSGNDLEHALIELGCLYAGIPYAPVSPAYSLLSSDFSKLKAVMQLLTPGLVYASMEGAFGRAIEAAVPAGTEVLFKDDFFSLEKCSPGRELEEAYSKVGPDTIAKFLFTSGSTGNPKAVINTQRMWCANQVMARTELAFLQDEPPVMVEWAPWHHTAGGNKDFGVTLFNGGALYIDEGKPMPGAIETTVRNLRDVAPTFYFNVPKGYEALLPYLRKDAALRGNFFSRVKILWFAGAGVSQAVFDEYKRLSIETCGEEVPFLTGYGATETGPFTLGRTWTTDDASNLGLPPPGADLKLVPIPGQDKYEARVKGPHITPGYWRQPELTKAAFDEEGYYRLGDAFVLADPEQPVKGLLYRGRTSEDFKLSSGTWVHVGALRAKLIDHFNPLVRDVVITGEGKSELGALVFPAAGFSRDEFAEKARSFHGTGSSNSVRRFLVLEDPPSLDAGEMTDKGSINQKAVLRNRVAQVEELYSDAPSVLKS